MNRRALAVLLGGIWLVAYMVMSALVDADAKQPLHWWHPAVFVGWGGVIAVIVGVVWAANQPCDDCTRKDEELKKLRDGLL